MDLEKKEAIYCEDDGEYSIFCDICDKLCIERYYKNHLKSQTRTNILFIKVNVYNEYSR